MTWEHEVVILEKNIRDLQKQLNQAHKRIATLVDQNRSKDVSLKAVGKIVDEELELVRLITNKNVSLKAIGEIVEEELKYKKPMYDQVPLKDIKEIVRKETEADIDGIVSL